MEDADQGSRGGKITCGMYAASRCRGDVRVYGPIAYGPDFQEGLWGHAGPIQFDAVAGVDIGIPVRPQYMDVARSGPGWLRCTDLRKKFAHTVEQRRRLLAYLFGGYQYLFGSDPGFSCRIPYLNDIRRHFVRTLCRLHDVAGYFAGGDTLFFHGGCDRGCYLIDRSDRLSYAVNGAYRFVGRVPHGRDLDGDFVGCLCRLACQRFDLVGDYRETFAGVAGARGLDRRV